MTNRKFKDGVFTTLFGDTEKCLELFNALQEKEYGPDTKVQMRTLSNALYAAKKNDLAFSIDDRFVVLVEHQSSICDNMPLRLLSYIARVYESIVDQDLIYKETAVELQAPEFYVLYNGEADYEVESVKRLSDSFKVKGQSVSLELEVKIININPDKGHTILKRDTTLNQYSLFIEKVRGFSRQGLSRDEAIQKAIDWCMEHDILKDFLKRNGSEVYNMLLEEYNVETAIRVAREETWNNAQKSIALDLLESGVPPEIIAKSTKLTLQQLEVLRKS